MQSVGWLVSKSELAGKSGVRSAEKGRNSEEPGGWSVAEMVWWVELIIISQGSRIKMCVKCREDYVTNGYHNTAVFAETRKSRIDRDIGERKCNRKKRKETGSVGHQLIL